MDPAQAEFERLKKLREKEKEENGEKTEGQVAKEKVIHKWMEEHGQSEPPVEF